MSEVSPTCALCHGEGSYPVDGDGGAWFYVSCPCEDVSDADMDELDEREASHPIANPFDDNDGDKETTR